jgi:hypothetical protein
MRLTDWTTDETLKDLLSPIAPNAADIVCGDRDTVSRCCSMGGLSSWLTTLIIESFAIAAWVMHPWFPYPGSAPDLPHETAKLDEQPVVPSQSRVLKPCGAAKTLPPTLGLMSHIRRCVCLLK